jgi:hypothetical protein
MRTRKKLISCARSGDLEAIRTASDRERDQGNEESARDLEVLFFEFQLRAIQAEQLRWIITNSPRPSRVLDLTIEEWIQDRGLPVTVEPFWAGTRRQGWILHLPTDGRFIEETAERAVKFFTAAFPRSRFITSTVNIPFSAAGRRAVERTRQ